MKCDPLSLLRSSWLHLFTYLLTKYLVSIYYCAPTCKVLRSECRWLFFFFTVFCSIRKITVCVHECACVDRVYMLRCNPHSKTGKTEGNRQQETFFMHDTEQGVSINTFP